MRRRDLLTDLVVAVVALVISIAVLQTESAPDGDTPPLHCSWTPTV